MPDTTASLCTPLVLLKPPAQCQSPEGVSLSRWVCVCMRNTHKRSGPHTHTHTWRYQIHLRGTAWSSRSFFHWLNLCWSLQPEVVGTYLHGIGTLGWGGLVWGWDSLLLRNPSEFLSTTHGCGTSPFHVYAPPTSLDGCGFFNSIVVRLSFNSIFVSSEQRLFYILVVIWCGCAKGWAISAYATTLTGSPNICVLKRCICNTEEWKDVIYYNVCMQHVHQYIFGESEELIMQNWQKVNNW